MQMSCVTSATLTFISSSAHLDIDVTVERYG